MNQHWHQVFRRTHADSEGTEVTLSAFAGVCFKCGTKGKKSNDPACPMKNSIGGGGGQYNSRKGGKARFSGKCNNCGKDRHKEADCWAKGRNESKKPVWYKKKEMGAITIDTSSNVEFLLC
jgi:hypothetical protein